MYLVIAACVVSVAALASLGYEKTCVLFNVAALASQIASEQNLDNDEGLKTAAKYYQVSTYGFTKRCNAVTLVSDALAEWSENLSHSPAGQRSFRPH